MAIRTGMVELVALLRRLTRARENEYSIGEDSYWSDEQLQDVLDRYRNTIRRLSLVPSRDYIEGVWVSLDYELPANLRNLERAGVNSGWVLRDTGGFTVSEDDYTVDWNAGIITFDEDTNNAYYYLDARAYDVYGAAVEVVEGKIAFLSNKVDWASDNHRISASQEAKSYMALLAELRRKAGGSLRSLRMIRVDEA